MHNWKSPTRSNTRWKSFESLDRHITSNFQVPVASFVAFMILSLILWVILYNQVLVPVALRIKGRQSLLGAKQKMGVGLFSCCISVASVAVVESVRRKIAIEQGYSEQPQAVVNMSAMWLLQCEILNGLAEAANGIGHNEFFLTELPQSMSSVASTLMDLGCQWEVWQQVLF